MCLWLSRVSNPLADIPYEDLMKDVELFAEDKGLQDKVDLIKKGALIAQDPSNFENLEVLSEEEKEWIRFEVDHKWKHPIRLYFTIIICSIGAGS